MRSSRLRGELYRVLSGTERELEVSECIARISASHRWTDQVDAVDLARAVDYVLPVRRLHLEGPNSQY